MIREEKRRTGQKQPFHLWGNPSFPKHRGVRYIGDRSSHLLSSRVMKHTPLLAILAALFLFTGLSVPAAGQQIRVAESVSRNLTYCSPRGKNMEMDVYYPTREGPGRPLAIFVHGGFWMSGDKAGEFWFHKIGSSLLEKGFVVASINYRLAPRYTFPVQLWDVRCAIRHFRAEADQYGIHPQQIGVWGTSAGGHLAALAATTNDTTVLPQRNPEYPEASSRPNAVATLYAPFDLTSEDFSPELQQVARQVFTAIRRQQEDGKTVSPLFHVDGQTPPFLVIHGTQDPVVPYSQAETFVDRLHREGAVGELITVPRGQHGLTIVRDPEGMSPEELKAAVVNFFLRYLR